MYLYKIKEDGLVFELGIPKKNNQKIIILLPGLPGFPNKQDFLKQLTKQGYITIYPRYRGTFESSGNFLSRSPAYDILELISLLKNKKEFIELYGKSKILVNYKEIIVLGSSFGGSISLHLSMLTKDVKKYIVIAPVLDFKRHNSMSKEQDLIAFGRFLIEAFPFVYRFKKKNYKKLIENKIIPSIFDNSPKLSGEIIVLHGDKDETVNIKNSKKLARLNKKIKFEVLDNMGHISFSDIGFEKMLKWLNQ